ncbi:uncharacterized protein LOC134241331 [Saccostrea cucullata]|uniref:uncharacterized protein LOC134241331 n=1 Tax=Saccostrea cuccullata TaxID=36930 RepID=UPI002ED55559
MKGMRVLRRGFSTSAIRRDVQDMEPRFLVPKSKPGSPFSYENLVVKRMKYYLKPPTDYTHNRSPFGKQYTQVVSVLALVYMIYNVFERAYVMPRAGKS